MSPREFYDLTRMLRLAQKRWEDIRGTEADPNEKDIVYTTMKTIEEDIDKEIARVDSILEKQKEEEYEKTRTEQE